MTTIKVYMLTYVHTISDSSCVGTKTISYKPSVHTDFAAVSVTERNWATPISFLYRIGSVHALVQCEQVFGPETEVNR